MATHHQGKVRRIVMAVGAVFALASMVIGATAPIAHATDSPSVPISMCGQSVNTDAVLVRNLTCPGDGVTISADGVTVDLGGHTIRSSTGTGSGIVIGAPIGATATVIGPGQVRGFLRGIDDMPRPDPTASLGRSDALPGYYRHHVIVHGVQLVDNTWGMQIDRDLTEVTHTTIRGFNGIGEVPCKCGVSPGDVTLESSSVTSTGLALYSEMSSSFLVDHSQLRGGVVQVVLSANFNASDSVLRDVQISILDGGTTIERTRMLDTHVWIDGTSGGVITDNVIRSTKGGTAFDVGGSSTFTSRFEGNRFSGWDDAIAVNVSAAAPGLFQVEITRNWFQENHTAISSRCSNNPRVGPAAIRHNTFTRNSGDAVRIDCGQWVVGDNRMVRNGGLGIDASGPDVQITDEGGNVAFGNAAPQCVGVVCLPRR